MRNRKECEEKRNILTSTYRNQIFFISTRTLLNNSLAARNSVAPLPFPDVPVSRKGYSSDIAFTMKGDRKEELSMLLLSLDF